MHAGIDDEGGVLDRVEPLSARWRQLATKLRLKESALDVIERDHPGDARTCLHMAMGEWLRLNYDLQKHELEEAGRGCEEFGLDCLRR